MISTIQKICGISAICLVTASGYFGIVGEIHDFRKTALTSKNEKVKAYEAVTRLLYSTQQVATNNKTLSLESSVNMLTAEQEKLALDATVQQYVWEKTTAAEYDNKLAYTSIPSIVLALGYGMIAGTRRKLF